MNETTDMPLAVFSGPWIFKDTGQSFSGADLDAAAYAVYRDRITALEAEVARLREELRQADEANQRALEAATHKDCQIAKDAGTVYAAIPPLPVTAETAEAATSALVEFCNLFSVFIEFDAAMRGDGGEG